MANQHPQLDPSIVELTQDVHVRTSSPPSCHSALRAGFAGYTDNPRWTPQKRQAWNQGKQWRSELAANLLEIKDGFLLTPETLAIAPNLTAEASSCPSPTEPKANAFQTLFNWSRRKPAMN
jgi:hypothetical protein